MLKRIDRAASYLQWVVFGVLPVLAVVVAALPLCPESPLAASHHTAKEGAEDSVRKHREPQLQQLLGCCLLIQSKCSATER